MGSGKSVSPATFQEQLDYDLKNGTSTGKDVDLDANGNPVEGGPKFGSNYGIDSSKSGWYGKAIQGEVQRRRGLITRAGGFDALPADAADIAIRDATTGRVARRGRQGSSNSALGSFSVTSALGADSLFGS